MNLKKENRQGSPLSKIKNTNFLNRMLKNLHQLKKLNQMVLTVQQIKDKLQNPTGNRNVLQKARQQENRLRLHSETSLSHQDASNAITKFLMFVKTLLPVDKYAMFLSLLRFPVPTVTLTEQIYTALEKIFDGRNPVFKYEFTSPNDAQDWEDYRTNQLKSFMFWKTKGFEAMKTAINSIAIVDLPEEQEGERPEPYVYLLQSDHVVDFEVNEKGAFEWIAFDQGKEKVAVFCDGFFRVFRKDKDSSGINYIPEKEVEHDLKYCPARFFWTTPINQQNIVVKKSPLSNQLGKLDLLLFWDVSNEHLNLYGRYPIYSGFASDCDFEDEQTGEHCDGGYLKNRSGKYIINREKQLSSCPVCAKKRLDGAGSYVEFDPPSRANDNADLRNPVSITTIDRASLDYNNEDIADRAMKIYKAVTGYQGMSINDKAVNEKQVIAIFESLEAALKTPQHNFEQVMQWADQTICLLRYGAESFRSASISLGTEHYIMTPSQIMEFYQFAKKSAFSTTALDMLEDLYYETEFKNNPEQLYRQKILINLDPFRHLTLSEVAALNAAQKVKDVDYLIKANFSSLILRFERENISVLEFGQNSSFEKKIKGIRETLEVYVAEMIPEQKKIEQEVPVD